MDSIKPSRNAVDRAESSRPGFSGNFGRFDEDFSDPGRVTLWHRLGRRWLIILGTTAFFVLAFGSYALIHPKIYTRSCGIAIEPAQRRSLGDAVSMEAYLNTQAELISSSTAIHTLALSILKQRQDKGLITLETIGTGGDDLAVLREGLTAIPSRKADIIDLQFNSRRSEEAAHILSALSEAYIQFASADHNKPMPENYKNVLADKDKWDKEIHEGHSKLADVQAEINLLQMQEGVSNGDILALKSLADERAAAEIRVNDAHSAFDKVSASLIPDAAKRDTLVNTGRYNGILIVPGHDESQIKTELYALRQRLSELRERFLPNHPSVVTVQQKLDEVSATYFLYLHREWTAADRRNKSLELSYEEQKRNSMDAAKVIRARLAIRQEQAKEIREVLQEKRKLTDLLVNRLDEATAINHQGTVIIHLLNEPDPRGAADKVRPNTQALLLEGLLAGLVLGITLTFVDPRIRSVKESVAAVDVAMIGALPRVAGSPDVATLGRLVHLDPMSAAADAFRAIRATIHFGHRGKTLLITSPERNDGKSILAANLAIAMAEAGQRVLLLDANLRQPTQQTIFSAEGDAGVSGVVTGRASIDQAIQSTQIRGLELMPCGAAPFSASEMINNQMFADMLGQLSAMYDFVVVDSPPVNSSTDSRILGAMCDLTVMVIRSGRTSRRSAMDARDGLLGFGANLAGVVVNAAPDAADLAGRGGLLAHAVSPRAAAPAALRRAGSISPDIRPNTKQRQA